ncbi:MAG: PAS domain S-box protein, partial [Elusimicrobia bacterium]|nr:PAS domain S-box protein [Elusimicrobiota bacterium]
MKIQVRPLRVWVAAGALCAAIVAVVAFQHRSDLRRARAETLHRLDALAGQQVEMISNWIEDGRVDLRACLALERSTAEKMAVYQTVVKRSGYVWIQHVDRSGRRIAGAPPGALPKNPPDARAVAEVLRRPGGTVVFGWEDKKSLPFVDVALPDGNGRPAVGALFLRLDPRADLFRTLRSAHTFSATAESVLARRDGAEIEFLTELRRPGQALRLPASSAKLVSAKILRGEAFDGSEVDYRGRRVVAAVRLVPDTDWLLITKVDADEIAAPILHRALIRGTLLVGFLFLSTALFLRLYRRQELLHAEREFEFKREIIEMSRTLDAFFRHSLTPIVFLDRSFNFLRVNEAYAKACGKEVSFFSGRNHFELFPHAENDGIFRQVVRTKTPYRADAKPFEFPDQPERGTTYWDWTLVPLLDSAGEVDTLVFSLADVTERVRAETELTRREAELDDLYNKAPCGYHSVGEDGSYLRVNDTELEWLGYRRDELVGLKKFGDLLTPASLKVFRAEFPDFKKRGWVRGLEFDMVRKDASILPVLLSATAAQDEAGRFVMSRATITDITERKRSDAARAKLTRSTRTLSLCNEALVRAKSESELLERICRLVVDQGGYRHAWVGFAVEDAAKSVRPVARACQEEHCHEEGDLERLNITWADGERGEGPIGAAIRGGTVEVCRDVQSDPRCAPWREDALKRGYRSAVALPIQSNGRAFGALMIYAAEPDAFSGEEISLLTDLSSDVSYGISALRSSAARALAEEALRVSEADLQRAQAVARIGSWTLNLSSNELSWSGETYRMFGVPAGAAMTYDLFLEKIHPDDRAAVAAAWTAALARKPYDIEHRILVNGAVKWVRDRAEIEFAEDGRALRGIGTVQDITERKMAELALARMTRSLRTLSLCNEALVRAKKESELLERVCRLVVEQGGYHLAWVGYRVEDAAKRVKPAAQAGYEEGYLDGINITWADEARGRGPSGTSIRNGTVEICRDVRTDPRMAPWREEALKRGYLATIALPLRSHGRILGALMIYSAEADAFTEEELSLLKELSDDLSYGIAALREKDARALSEEALRAANAYNRSLIEVSLDPLVTIGADGRITDVNLAMLAATARSRGEVIGTAFAAHVTKPQDAQAGYEKVLREGLVRDYPLEILARDGRVTPVLFNATVYRDETGSVAGVFAAARDVTERLRLEKEREQFFKFFQTSTDLMCMADPNGAFIRTNPAFAQTLGYSEAELRAKPFVDFVAPEDKQATVDEMARQMRKGFTLNFENRYVCKDGSFRWLSWRAVYNQAEGITYATARDMTEQKRAEEALHRTEIRYRRLFESANDGIAIVDAQTEEILDANPALLELFGFSREECVGRRLWDIEPFKGAAAADRNIREQLSRGKGRHEDLSMRAKDGRELAVELNMNLYTVNGGVVLQYTVRDVSERKRLQARILHGQKMESVGLLAGGIAHDLNNILMVILGNVSFLLSSLGANDPRRADVEEIRIAEERAAALTRQLLVFSRKQPVNPVVLDLHDLIRNLQKMLGRILGEDIKIEAALCSEPVLVHADAGQLEQVIMNLAVNARDAMPRGGRLGLRTWRPKREESCHPDCTASGPEGCVRLEVSDTGTGMTPEVVAHLFEPFFTTKPAGKGTGLGLATVYGIVRQTGGGISARSAPGRGT